MYCSHKDLIVICFYCWAIIIYKHKENSWNIEIIIYKVIHKK